MARIFNTFKLCSFLFVEGDFMNVSTVGHYFFNTVIGAGSGALFSMMIKNLQVWQSPKGGIIACLYAERVAMNPFHINIGFTFTGSAKVPMDYTLLGKVVPTICTFNTLLISCVGVGILIGVCYTSFKRKSPGTTS